MTDAELRKFWRTLLKDLGIVSRLDPWILCQRLAERLGKSINVEGHTIPGVSGVGFGSLVPFPDEYLIVHAADVSIPYQSYIICHELTHIARNHPRGGEMLCGNFTEIDKENQEPGAGKYFSSWKEWEAETSAAILVEMANRPAPLIDIDASGLSESERLYARAVGGRALRGFR
ncbi:hypothetical protein [Pseudonocardia sp. ICBG1293]|uniref:hypothetical protein n=1 Tax=Pseudonocardia sp. ICBG1293 TaxID=2844382 RepID=UPI001CCB0B57|nr:hypothetical protein [Pseudonocardia sp. ICBG1293]